MSFRATVLRQSYLTAYLVSLLAAPAAFGQVATSPVAFANQDAITTSFVVAPNLAGTAGAAGSADNNWLKVEVHFGTTDKLITPYLDSVDVQVWIEGRDLQAKNAAVPGQGITVMLTGKVTYINVAAAKDVYGVFYVHPSTLGRYSGDGGYQDFDRKFDIHAKLLVGGAVMDEINKNKEADSLGWYTKFPVIPNLVLRQDQTPFIIADPDRYPEIKPIPAAQ